MKLSILITSYNHEKYLAEAIESAVQQKTDAPFEIVISDDFSQDSSKQIAENYRDRFPHLIRLLDTDRNLGITKNLQKGFAACKGEYIAYLEGDDYWISPYKVQRQIEFLDQNSDCPLCFNGVLILDGEGMLNEHATAQIRNRNSFSIFELIEDNSFMSNISACMYRNETIQKLPAAFFEMPIFDWVLNIACAEMGKVGCVPAQMTVYRKQGQGYWASLAEEKQIEMMLNLIPTYDRYFNFRYSKQFRKVAERYQNHLYMIRLKAFCRRFLKPLRRREESHA